MVETLFIVTSDPRRSHRPAEAIRIAAGIGSWKKVGIKLYLHGPATLCLGEFPEDLVSGANIQRYLPMLAEAGHQILIQEGADELKGIEKGPLPCTAISENELAKLSASARYLLHF